MISWAGSESGRRTWMMKQFWRHMVSTNLASCALFQKLSHPLNKNNQTLFLLPDGIASVPEDRDYFLIPHIIVRFDQVFNAGHPETGQIWIIGKECTLVHDPASSGSPLVQDKEAPAPVIPANLRSRQMNGAEGFPVFWVIPQKGAGFFLFQKNSFV